MVKNPPANAGDTGSIPGSGRSPGVGYPVQYSCLENPTDRGAWRVHGFAKSQPRLSTVCTQRDWTLNAAWSPGWCPVAKSCLTLLRLHGQAPLSMGFPRQEYWSGCHFLLQRSSRLRDQTCVFCIGKKILHL